MRTLSILPLLLVAAACQRVQDDPVARATAFVRLARRGECAEMWPFYTKAAQQQLERRTEKEYSNPLVKPPPVEQRRKPYQWECFTFADLLPRSLREQSRQGDTVNIAAIARTGVLFPIIPFLMDPRKDTPTQMRMIREEGAWRVWIHPIPEDPYRRTADHGKWSIDWPRSRPADRGGYTASGLMDADTEAAERVFLDYEGWPRWMPYLVEARALTPMDSTRRQRIYGRFQLPGDSVGVDFVFDIHFALLTREREFKGFGASWRIAEGDPTPGQPGHTRLTSWGANLSWRVYQLVSGPAGLLVNYAWSGRPEEWPASLAAKVFTPEYAAQVMDNFEREARSRHRAGMAGTP